MVNILLPLPNELHQRLTADAAAAGIDFEDYLRSIIEANRPVFGDDQRDDKRLADEPIVKAAEIEAEYHRLGYTYGWRFITCPYENLRKAKLLLVSLNPAGTVPHGPPWSQEAGSAYRVESWDNAPIGQARLQRQIQALFQILGLCDEEVFSAHYVPFRSPSWETLSRRDEAQSFALQLWTWLKPKLTFEKIVCVGKDQPAQAIAQLFNAKREGSFAVGWGNVSADRYRLPDGRSLIALPHLSRFSIFGRPEGAEALRRLFDV